MAMAEKLYYMQDTREYVGNSMLWWARDRCGYTCDIRNAHVFSETEALKQEKSRDSDRAWPKDYIDKRVSGHVDMQHCMFSDARPDTTTEAEGE